MNKQALKTEIVNAYNRMAFTHHYVFGYVEGGKVYGAEVRNGAEILEAISFLDFASNGGVALKYRPSKKQIALIIENAVAVREICTEDALETEYRTTKYNRGQIFERLTREALHGKSAGYSNANFTTCGDIIVNGEHVQVKYNRATFTDTITLKNLG